MSNLNTYLDSLQKSKSDQPNFIDMQALSIFSSVSCRVTHGSLAELTLGSSRDMTCGSLWGDTMNAIPVFAWNFYASP
jgi:hypothetical protein